MNKCFICKNGDLVRVANVRGEEVYCNDCRRVIVSSALNFKFSKEKPVDCMTSDGRPGYKGPGKKAVCHGYSNDEEKQEAYRKADASRYSFENKRAASKLINAVAYFSGSPDFVTGDSSKSNKAQNFNNPNIKNPDMASNSAIDGATTTDNGINVQMGDLNKSNPLNSGTTASRRLADLISEELGPSFCTEHMIHDECNHNRNSQ